MRKKTFYILLAFIIIFTGCFNKNKIKEENNNKQIIDNEVDREKPTIENVQDIEIFIGDEVDFYKNINISDNSKGEIKKKIVGDYDINKAGEYSLKYVIQDENNNKTEASFKLIVKEKPIEKKNNTKENEPKKENKSTNLTTKGYKIEQIDGIYYINGILVANKTYSLPNTYNPGKLLDEFMNNYNAMANDASKEGINLNIISGFRSYDTQSVLYNRYASRDGVSLADTYSARAGHSEHQTGLAADINSLDQDFEYTEEGKWLNANCSKYGFIIRYPKGKEEITGYMFEPWHIRYVGTKVSKELYNDGNWITLEEYLGINSKYLN